MTGEQVYVRFTRDGSSEGVDLDSARAYQVSVDGGPRSEFHAPWNQSRLDELVDKLRNTTDDKPDMEVDETNRAGAR